MSAQPTIRIKGKAYEYPASSKLGDAALIERLTDLTHAEWRRRYRDSLQAVIDGDENVEEDSAISIGIVAMAVARANPRWTRTQVVEFVNALDWDEVEFEAGEETDPLAAGAESAPTTEPTGTPPAEPSRSDSDTGSSESTTPPTYGTATSPTSPEAQSDQATWDGSLSISTSTS